MQKLAAIVLVVLFVFTLLIPPAVLAEWPAKGSPVLITRSNGFVIQGQLVSMSDRKIKLRSDRGALMTFRGNDLQNVKTRNDTFTWDKNQNRFVSALASAERVQAEAARKQKQLEEAVAHSGGEKLKGVWTGYMRHLPANASTSGAAIDEQYRHSLCVLYVDTSRGNSAAGTLIFPEDHHTTSVRLTCKPLSEANRKAYSQREQRGVKSIDFGGSSGKPGIEWGGAANVPHFDLTCELESALNSSQGVKDLRSFAGGAAWTNKSQNGVLPTGLTLSLESIAGTEAIKNRVAYTAIALSRYADLRSGDLYAGKLPVSLAETALEFDQGTYTRTTGVMYDTGKNKRWVKDWIGDGYHEESDPAWKQVPDGQFVPHVRFFGTIENPTATALDVRVLCLFHVDNEGLFFTGNMPHRQVFDLRLPAKTSFSFAQGHKLPNTMKNALAGQGLVGAILNLSQALVPQSDDNWHVPHVTKVTAAIISATAVKANDR